MSFKCDICEKVFKTNQHLNQHKNRKKICHKNNQNTKPKINDEDILKIINTQNKLIEENSILKNIIKIRDEQFKNIKYKQQLTRKFIKYILNNDQVNEDIVNNISLLITEAENKELPFPSNSSYSNNIISSNLLSNTNYNIRNVNTSENSIISDLTSPLSDKPFSI
jgi:hypothetical protein